MGASSPSPQESESGQPITGINVTPLVDVVLVLLIIFMATAPLLQRRSLNVNVPKAAHAEKTKATETLAVLFTADRQLILDKTPFTLDQAAEEFRRRLLLDASLHVSLSADETVPYGEVVGVLDVIRGAGVKKVALEVKQKPS